MSPALSSREIRHAFLEFFERHDHLRIPNASVVPRNDPTLLFINSGMAPLKPYFTGVKQPPSPRLCNVQPCIRTIDIEDVGDRHHLTVFEMLGSWSIGDYFKERAIELAFELLTEVLGFSKNDLYATVFAGDPSLPLPPDDDSAGFWEKVGMARDHIVPQGIDNFWRAGDTGPCGPCTEVFIDTGDQFGAAYKPGGEFDTKGRYIEIWNAGVFMQYDAKEDGSYSPLPFVSVDTGSGLERLALAMHRLPSVYETDLLAPVLNAVSSGLDGTDVPIEHRRLICDHVRAATVMLGDGVRPSNEGRGYIPRRLIRKCVAIVTRAGRPNFDFGEPIAQAVEIFGDFYPNVRERHDAIVKAFTAERDDFSKVISRGLEQLERFNTTPPFEISGKDAFNLFATYGLPFELVRDFAAERGGSVDATAFEQEYRGHQEISRRTAAGGTSELEDEWSRAEVHAESLAGVEPTTFLGYQTTRASGSVVALLRKDAKVDEVNEDEFVEVVTDQTPFYAEGGGQVGDTGEITSDRAALEVTDCQKSADSRHYLHRCRVTGGTLRVGDSVELYVDVVRRRKIMANHSATHLLQGVLRRQLGDHVQQKGSLVDDERLRFDFTHERALTAEQIAAIERELNQEVFADLNRTTDETSYDDAIRQGVIAFFGDTYGELVRVVRFDGVSAELCGGTHVNATGEIGLVRIVDESSVASGVRRIVALTGDAALDWTLRRDAVLAGTARQLKVGWESLGDRIAQIQSSAGKKKEAPPGRRLAADAIAPQEIAPGVVLVAVRADGDAASLREQAFDIVAKTGAVTCLVATEDDKVRVSVAVPDALKGRVDAAALLRTLAPHIEGRGGGDWRIAQGGGAKPSGVDAFLAAIGDALASQITSAV